MCTVVKEISGITPIASPSIEGEVAASLDPYSHMIYEVDSVVFLRIANRERLEEKEMEHWKRELDQFSHHTFNSSKSVADVCFAARSFGVMY